ncbi:hypothetical protein GCM10010988_02230 [Cnuibacter physcomitrellae]|nr:hypothetical protein GCM10010988_02230 [Cnuibacter physcomitrellae]
MVSWLVELVSAEALEVLLNSAYPPPVTTSPIAISTTVARGWRLPAFLLVRAILSTLSGLRSGARWVEPTRYFKT